MSFQIPESLDQFSAAGLEDLARIAKGEFNELRASVTQETVTEDELARLEELRDFAFSVVPEEVERRQDVANRFAAATEEPEAEVETAEEAAEPEVAPEQPAAVTASTKAPKVTDLVQHAPEPDVRETSRATYSALVASASVNMPGGGSFESGQKLNDLVQVAKLFEARSAGHQGMYDRGMSTQNSGPVIQPVAQLVRDYPAEFSVNFDSEDYDKLLAVGNEKRLPGGSLLASVDLRRKQVESESPFAADAIVAAQGWCAPSETDYDICLQISTDGLADFPEVQARRGGIRHNTGIEFDSIFGGGNCASPTGFFDLTEAQVAAGTVKTCLEIPCPDFVDTRLGVTGLCLTGNILAIRGYPEFTATFTRGALAASAHQINREQIADVVAGSTAVTLTGTAPWATDLSVVSQVLSAIELATVDIKYRLRMQRSSTLEVILPWWILAQMRADWVRRNATGNGPEAITLADSAINSAISARGARAQYVYDWQDAFATCAASGAPGSIGPGADVPLTELPTSLQFLVYPAGTWIRAVSDVITLNSVYDSTKLATNQVTHLFTETGWAMVKMCPVSRVYTVPICPNGKTGLQRDVTC